MNEPVPASDTDFTRGLQLEPARRPFWRRGWFLLLAIVLVIAAAGAGYRFWRAQGPVTYITVPAMRGPLTVTVNATGTLQPQDQVDVGAEISGRVDSVKVDYNDRVKRGQVLAIINTDQLRAQLAQAQASMNANRANVVNNEATVRETLDHRNRARGLVAHGGISTQDAETAEAAYDRAVASVAKAKADVENASAQVAMYQTQIEKALVRSPIDGVVLDRKVSTGQTVAATFQTPVLFTLASDLSVMQLQVDVDEADIGLVKEGQTATFSVDAYPQRRFDARLISLRNSPKTANGVVTYQGVLTVDNKEMLLRPGLTATVDILVSDTKDALLVPNGALRFAPPASAATAPPLVPGRNGETVGRVWVLENNRAIARDLRIGRSDGRNTEVLSGNLKPGEPIITDTATRANGT
ncbi:MAG TPA: efflux RND transporter periplasmic adaptor subunit [Micropepsaceae bacterium]|jgi:HlyD family secretion protein|nr:efflux RND transporter periplasmic adaptor subunit [Micropepsaceae bacterium]